MWIFKKESWNEDFNFYGVMPAGESNSLVLKRQRFWRNKSIKSHGDSTCVTTYSYKLETAMSLCRLNKALSCARDDHVSQLKAVR